MDRNFIWRNNGWKLPKPGKRARHTNPGSPGSSNWDEFKGAYTKTRYK